MTFVILFGIFYVLFATGLLGAVAQAAGNLFGTTHPESNKPDPEPFSDTCICPVDEVSPQFIWFNCNYCYEFYYAFHHKLRYETYGVNQHIHSIYCIPLGNEDLVRSSTAEDIREEARSSVLVRKYYHDKYFYDFSIASLDQGQKAFNPMCRYKH